MITAARALVQTTADEFRENFFRCDRLGYSKYPTTSKIAWVWPAAL